MSDAAIRGEAPLSSASGRDLPDVSRRQLGWLGNATLALGGCNQSLFLIGVLFAGSSDFPGHGSAAVPLLAVGLVLALAAAPGWTELVLMSPRRVGGISAACTEAFRPYSPILSALAGACSWWGWAPSCGLTALLAASLIQNWFLPAVPAMPIAALLVIVMAAVNMMALAKVARVAAALAVVSATLAFLFLIVPVLTGQVDWSRAVDFHLDQPFPGAFGTLTSGMAGLYLIGYGAPAFEAALTHAGETRDPVRNLPRAMLASSLVAVIYFAALPVVWLGALGPASLGVPLVEALGPTVAPLFGAFAKAATVGFLLFNLLNSTLLPLTNTSRTLAQLSADGLAPRCFQRRLDNEAPWCAILATAAAALLCVLLNGSVWFVAATNFTYLIGISLPSVAVWLLRRDAPAKVRPYRAPRVTVGLGLCAALAWGASALLGFQQFGLPTVVFGLVMAHSGAAFYAWRRMEDRRRAGLPLIGSSLHLKLTGAMAVVLSFDTVGYMLAFEAVPSRSGVYTTVLADIFVLVALLTLTVGLVMPGFIARSAEQVDEAARRLSDVLVRDFVGAMKALGEGRLEAAHTEVAIVPVDIRSRDELGAMADSVNALQFGIQQAAQALDRAREALGRSHSALEDARMRAVHDSLHDELTGLPNRTQFLEALRGELDEAAAGWQAPTVLFIDFDRFKDVNDSLGHAAGDDLLIQATKRLRTCVARRGGVTGGRDRRDVLARIGGDEFTIMLRGPCSEADALAVAAELMAALDRPFQIGSQMVFSAISIGVAVGRDTGGSAEDMMRDADMALYKAKAQGRGRAEVFRAVMHDRARNRLRLEMDMHRALAEGEFLLLFQPLVGLSSGRVQGFEALVRWKHPEKGMVSPADFIPLAEETGLIVPLGQWVLREACTRMVGLQDLCGPGEAPYMSINMSPVQLAQSDIVAQVRAVLAETGVQPSSIKIEITESAALGSSERANRVLNELKALGVRLSIDDFGTGHSALSYLQDLPFDVLKIDRSFVSNLPDHQGNRKLVNAILRMAESLELDVIVEGIETEAQAQVLRDLGCETGQGYLFSRPVPFADAMALTERIFADELHLAHAG